MRKTIGSMISAVANAPRVRRLRGRLLRYRIQALLPVVSLEQRVVDYLIERIDERLGEEEMEFPEPAEPPDYKH
jgi:hypothetical protein